MKGSILALAQCILMAAQEEIVPTCRELGIGIVAYSPLGRGFLTGAIKSREDLQCVPTYASCLHFSAKHESPVVLFMTHWGDTIVVADSYISRTLRSVLLCSANDRRADWPRFSEGAFEANMALVERVKELAAKKGVTPGQLALAWVHAQGPDVFPIPGTKRVKYLQASYPEICRFG